MLSTLEFKTIIYIIKYIPLQQGLRPIIVSNLIINKMIIKYIPLQQGLRQL